MREEEKVMKDRGKRVERKGKVLRGVAEGGGVELREKGRMLETRELRRKVRVLEGGRGGGELKGKESARGGG